MKQDISLLERLTNAAGVSGYEGKIAEIMAQELKGLGRISHDKLGSIICEKRGAQDKPRIMIAAHMDEIGFMVKQITKQGFIKFVFLGGWVTHYLPSQRVMLKTSRGDIPGVIGSKPSHFMTPEERKRAPTPEQLFIDVGAADRKEVERLGVKPGDPIVPDASLQPMANPDYLLSKAFDDRLGCAVMIGVLKNIRKKRHPNTVFGVGTVQEEIGLRGARTAVHKINPDIAIICEMGLAQDMPGGQPDPLVSLGKGPKINLFDRGMIPNLALRDWTIETARKARIPYQLDVSERTANDAAVIHLNAEGVPTIYIGTPGRYVHSDSSLIYKPDFDNAVRLVTEIVLRLDAKKAKSFTR